MQTLTQPTLLLKPFAESGDKNSIPDVNTDTSNPQLADLTSGFPPIVSEDPDDGGLPPERKDFNGLGYLTTTYDFFYQAGGTFTFNSTISSAIGGYPLGARLWYDDGNGHTAILKSTKGNNTDNFVTTPSYIGTSWVAETPVLGWNNTWTGDNTFTGDVDLGSNATVATPPANDDSTSVANTEWVNTVASSYSYGATPKNITELYDGNYASITGSPVITLSESWKNFEELVVVACFNSGRDRIEPKRYSTYWLEVMLNEGNPCIWENGTSDYLTVAGYNETIPSTDSSFKVTGHAYCYLGKIYGVNRKSS